jgi:polyisoprenyl-phosphate glycosyltransferase
MFVPTVFPEKKRMVDISIVIPVRDEEQNIGELTHRIFTTIQGMQKSFEIIYVTDINKDNTVCILEEFSQKFENVKTLKLSNSFGQHVAVLAGLDHSNGKYAVVMDGDLQDLPEDIPVLYQKIQLGYEIVYGVKEKKNDTPFRNLSSRLFNGIMNRLSDVKIDSNSSMFRIISRKAIDDVTRFREFEPSLTYIFSYINLPTAYVPVRSGTRAHGETKYSFIRLVEFAISSLLGFSRKPLRMISNFGFIVSLLSFLYFLVVLYQYFFYKIEILGWATIIVLITFLGGLQLLSIGVIGEYIGRIYMQSKNRPLYIIEKKYGNFVERRTSNE